MREDFASEIISKVVKARKQKEKPVNLEFYTSKDIFYPKKDKQKIKRLAPTNPHYKKC